MNLRHGFVLSAALVFLLLQSANAYAQQAGMMRYNDVAQKMEFFDGTQWYYFGISLPLGICDKAGVMDFDNLLSAYQYCNGSFLFKIVGVPTLTPCAKKAELEFSGNTYIYCNGLVWVNIKGAASSS